MRDINNSYKWVAALVVMLGMFITLLDTTIVDITIPKMIPALNTDIYGIQWVVIAYMVGSAIAMTIVGWFGDVTSYKFVYILGLVIFLTASAFCGQATSLGEMILERLIQGIGEGLIVPISMTILLLSFPKEEAGLAMGIYGLGASFAPALGPTIGGLLTEYLNWRWIFYVNIPVGIIAFLLATFLLEEHKPEGTEAKDFDWLGFILLAIFLGSLITFLTKGQEKGWLFSDFIIKMMLIALFSGILFIIWQFVYKHPLWELKLFKYRLFTIGTAGRFIFGGAMYGSFYLMPLYMESLRGYTTLLAGFAMLPCSLAMGVSVIIGGILSDKLGARPVSLVCVILLSISTYMLGSLDLYTSKLMVIILFMLWGFPIGPLFPTLTSKALNSLPDEKVNRGSSIFNVTRLIAGCIGTAFATTMLQRKAGYYFSLYSYNTSPGSKTFIQAYLKAMAFFHSKGFTKAQSKILSNYLMSLYIKMHAYCIAYQSVFKILAIIVLCVFPLLIFFYDSNAKEKRLENLNDSKVTGVKCEIID